MHRSQDTALLAGPTSHEAQLDGLRAFAVGGVLYAHFFAEQSQAGHQGVRLFFVLSGFLITRILVGVAAQSGFRLRTALGAFYMRRLLRIVPAYLALIVATFTLGAVTEWGTLKWFVTFTANFLYAIRDVWDPWVMGHTWSLAIEEQFYALWPLIIFLAPPNRRQAVCWAAFAISVAYRCFLPFTLEPSLARDLLPPASMDALAAGALLAVYRTGGSTLLIGRLGPLAAASLAAYAIALVSAPTSALGDWARWALLEWMLLPVFLFLTNGAVEGFGGLAGKVLANRHMRFLGRISYGIYLYHFLVLWAVLTLFPQATALTESGPVRFLLCGGLTVALASLSWALIEQPINTLKRHFPYTRAGRRTEILEGT